MPRKRPGALRAEQTIQRLLAQEPRFRQIDGISRNTNLAIRRAELSWEYGLFPGDTELAWRRYRAFLRAAPGQSPLYPRTCVCWCPECSLDDVRNARDTLEQALGSLAAAPRAELARAIRPLDDLYERRTLPDPSARARLWWHRRICEASLDQQKPSALGWRARFTRSGRRFRWL